MQRWNLPDGWVISNQPAHQALVGEADYIAAQDVGAARGADARHHVSPEDIIAALRNNDVTLTFDPAAGTLHAEGGAAIQIVTRKEGRLTPRPEQARHQKGARRERRRSQIAGRRRSSVTISWATPRSARTAQRFGSVLP